MGMMEIMVGWLNKILREIHGTVGKFVSTMGLESDEYAHGHPEPKCEKVHSDTKKCVEEFSACDTWDKECCDEFKRVEVLGRDGNRLIVLVVDLMECGIEDRVMKNSVNPIVKSIVKNGADKNEEKVFPKCR